MYLFKSPNAFSFYKYSVLNVLDQEYDFNENDLDHCEYARNHTSRLITACYSVGFGSDFTAHLIAKHLKLV